LNVFLGLYFIGNVIKEPTKKVKNEKKALFISAIIIGGLFGFIGNIFATSLLEVQKTVAPSHQGLIFIFSAGVFLCVFWKFFLDYKEAMG
jgi:heme A synthase